MSWSSLGQDQYYHLIYTDDPSHSIQAARLTTCLLHVGPPYGSLVWNDSGFVSFTWWRTSFFIVFNCVFTHVLMPCNIITLYFRLPCFHGSNSVLLFTRGQFWPSGIVVACVCVCMCVCPCVRQSWACPCDNSSTVQARITKFGSEM